MRKRGETYQIALIGLGAAALAMYGVFVYREAFPEYRIYQNDYIALENFHTSYTHQPPPAFSSGVKQIVIEREDRGPAIIDRCTSCHVTLQIPYFSPTKIAHDINGQIMRDEQGIPVKVPNEDYIWKKLDDQIAALTDEKVLEQLRANGENSVADSHLKEAEKLRALKTAKVDNYVYDVTKVLAMHPLIGKETRPFEFHNLNQYGCVSCHNGNGRGLTTDKAHGPVVDDQYEIEFTGPKKEFLELDPKNDPMFAKEFNDMPGPDLIFQTTPIFIGSLIQAKCVQCHLPSSAAIKSFLQSTEVVTNRSSRKANAIQQAFQDEKNALISLLILKRDIASNGIDATIKSLQEKSQDYSLPPHELDQITNQLNFLAKDSSKPNVNELLQTKLSNKIVEMVGSSDLTSKLDEAVKDKNADEMSTTLDEFIAKNMTDPTATGSLFIKAAKWNLEQELMRHVTDTTTSLKQAANDQTFLSAATSDIDVLMHSYIKGQQLYISQACYACHRISGFSRGGVGPELTAIGNSYPWYLKEKISWPQGNLPTSTMPNYQLDHEELEDVMTFLLGQKGTNQIISPTEYKIAISEWEAGRKSNWEKPITPAQIHNLRYSMTVFATEGCSACHRLEGFESNVGYSIQKNKDSPPDFNAIYNEREWFTNLFPENIIGSEIVKAIDNHTDEINTRISENVREGSILEDIEKSHPGHIEALYTPFKYAARAKNTHFAKMIAAESDPDKKAKLMSELKAWKAKVHRVLMMFIQEYGLGRLIGPRPNWSGIFRSDEWLMEHFHNPSEHSPNSIMPAFPFDDTKFYGLTYMLDKLAVRNRNAVREIWENRGFYPEQAFQIHCAQCHGESRLGNGPVAEWIYPIPKNLRNADFLRNLTRENAILSITHGIKGTPMPPWGEVAEDKPAAEGIPVLNKQEIAELVNWLFSQVPGGQVIKSSQDVPKWQYTPRDVLQELEKEGNTLKAAPPGKEEAMPTEMSILPTGKGFYASLQPTMIQMTQQIDSSVSEVFDVEPNPNPGSDKDSYYIKKKFYTRENIEAGKTFFEMNCAVCHGTEGDGTGPRASFMQDAKPMMLTNLDWEKSRDDLRLLRSIKYGIAGTAMIPWGDFTSSLQRLQLVIFIRSLSESREQREALFSTLYKTFETAQMTIENARVSSYTALENVQNEYQDVRKQQNKIYDSVEQGAGADSIKDAAALYMKSLDLLKKLKENKDTDQLFQELRNQVKHEEETYQLLGISLMGNKYLSPSIFDSFLKLISLNENRYQLKDGKLIMQINPGNEKQIEEISKMLISVVDTKLAETQRTQQLLEGKPDRQEELKTLTAATNSLMKLRKELISDLEEAARIRQKQVDLYKELETRLNGKNGNI